MKKSKTISLDHVKDKYIGKVGTAKRDQYEFDLRLDLLVEELEE